jgi:hypothetical protein
MRKAVSEMSIWVYTDIFKVVAISESLHLEQKVEYNNAVTQKGSRSRSIGQFVRILTRADWIELEINCISQSFQKYFG